MSTAAHSDLGPRIARSIDWDAGAIVTLDQTALPFERRTLRLETVDHLIDAIGKLAIRGAPALGAAGALGVALSARHHLRDGRAGFRAVRTDAERIASARPTAVNLAGGVRRALRLLDQGSEAVLAEALSLLVEDEHVNEATGRRAADLIPHLCHTDRPLRVLTHCNTGRLATVAHGTALGAIKELANRGGIVEVLAGETRPLLQGARLTTWELAEAGVPHRVCVDSAGPAAIAAGMIDCVLVGADRIADNGDVANKIGTYALAVAAARHGVPFVVVAPESTIDPGTASGADIIIEERSPTEVTQFAGRPTTPADTRAFNPAFDVTPASLVTATITENTVLTRTNSLPDRVRQSLTTFANFPRSGITFQDLGGLYRDPALISELAATIAATFRGDFDTVVAIEARGFALGAAVSQHAHTPLVLARKPGKLPGPVCSIHYGLEYGADVLEIQKASLPLRARVLVVDDVLATGGTVQATTELIAREDMEVAGIAVMVEILGLGGRQRIAGHRLFAGCQITT